MQSPEAAADRLAAAQDAFERAEWALACEHYAAALAADDSPEAHEGLSRALFWAGRGPESFEHRLRAFEGFRRRGDLAPAANLAVHIAADYRIAGNASLARGWLSRSEQLAAALPEATEAHAWLAIEQAKRAEDPLVAEDRAREALAVAGRLGDAGLEAAALSHLGRALLAQGRVAEGLGVLDQALATATCAETGDPLSIGDACCTTLVACDGLADARRARDWSQAVVEFTHRRRYTPLTAWCRGVYAGFLVLTGQWDQAEQLLGQLLAEARRLGRPVPADARATLAILRVRQGRTAEAARLLEGCADLPAALEPLVRVHLAEGALDLAEDRVERRLAARTDPPVLALRAEVRLARRDAAGARAAVAQLAGAARDAGREDLQAAATVLGARAARLAGEAPDTAALERAVAELTDLELPLEAAEARTELARGLADTHPALAAEHARGALATFERLGAARNADAAAALLRDLGVPGRPAPRTADVLTRREQEILGLLAEGLSNAAIAERLVISPRTAEHHVRAVLRKLGLRNRAEAAAHAVRSGA